MPAEVDVGIGGAGVIGAVGSVSEIFHGEGGCDSGLGDLGAGIRYLVGELVIAGLELGRGSRERAKGGGEAEAAEPSLLLLRWNALMTGTVGVMSRVGTSSMPSILSSSFPIS
jgi:hypothetical protein